ncbi:hypothetical protein ACH4MT_29175 [Streptomyces anulatus]
MIARLAGSDPARPSFGEKYGDTARIVDIGDIYRELCGGTHVALGSQVCTFRLLSEGSIGSSLRRIEALTSHGALRHHDVERRILKEVSTSLGTRRSRAPRPSTSASGLGRRGEGSLPPARCRPAEPTAKLAPQSDGVYDFGYGSSGVLGLRMWWRGGRGSPLSVQLRWQDHLTNIHRTTPHGLQARQGGAAIPFPRSAWEQEGQPNEDCRRPSCMVPAAPGQESCAGSPGDHCGGCDVRFIHGAWHGRTDRSRCRHADCRGGGTDANRDACLAAPCLTNRESVGEPRTYSSPARRSREFWYEETKEVLCK